jgi:hypothetical protein
MSLLRATLRVTRLIEPLQRLVSKGHQISPYALPFENTDGQLLASIRSCPR